MGVTLAKSGQARVPTSDEQQHLFDVIKQHRHPEKNTAIMQISFKLGLRVQEIALLKLKEVCRLGRPKKNSPRDFNLHEIMALPASYTKGADALKRSKTKYDRKTVSFNVNDFDRIVLQIEQLAQAGVPVVASDFYPSLKKHKGKSRDLPMIDAELRWSLEEYLKLRLEFDRSVKPGDPLFVTQKNGAYSPNTLQEHMALMLRDWAGIEKASSHSGRRSLITDVIHNQKKSVKVAQKIAGHASPSTTIIYEEPPEEEIADALKNVRQINLLS